jgi:hypothetical protein
MKNQEWQSPARPPLHWKNPRHKSPAVIPAVGVGALERLKKLTHPTVYS